MSASGILYAVRGIWLGNRIVTSCVFSLWCSQVIILKVSSQGWSTGGMHVRFMILPQFNEAKRILRCDHRSTPASVIPTSYTWFKGANGDEVTTSVVNNARLVPLLENLAPLLISFVTYTIVRRHTHVHAHDVHTSCCCCWSKNRRHLKLNCSK